ncbi:FUSC family protein [Micromonospora sp. M12]
MRHRGGQAGRIRARQWEVTLVISIQAGLAAAIAALLAKNLLGPGAHVFAPAAAVGTIATAIGQRARRTFELLGGVGLGIVIGDTLRYFLGSGPWQTGAVVALAIAAALLVAGRGGQLVGQAGGTAVLIATLAPMERGLEVPGSSTRSSAGRSAWWWSRCCCRSTRCECWTGPPRRSTRSSASSSTSWRRHCGSAMAGGPNVSCSSSGAPRATWVGCTTR